MVEVHETAHHIWSDVRDQYGISLSEVSTGGGCMALEARLESGHWIVCTDEGLCGFRERISFESYEDNYNTPSGEDPRALGWYVGIYPHGGDDEDWSGQDPILFVTDDDAYAADLPAVIGKALKQLMNRGMN